MENETNSKKEKGSGTSRRESFFSFISKSGKVLVIFAFVFGIIFLALNFNSLYSQVKYWFDTDLSKKQYETPSMISQLPTPQLSNTNISTPPSSSSNNSDSSNNGSSRTISSGNDQINIANNQLAIPKIDLRAPILWNIEAKNAIDKLREGLVHIKPTALPGDKNGNVFITGHSSYYPWDPGKYKHVFALLPNMKKGDKVYIQHQGTLFKYEVFETVTVKPDETWVMQPDKRNMVSLMTCVPIGTNLRRFVVRAQQIKPSPVTTPIATDKEKKETEEEKEISDDLMPSIFN
jgi:sortase A